MTTKQAFVSHDGSDANGVRAEVYVQKGVGKIIEIDRHDNGKTARINVKNPDLKHGMGGFINLDDPLFPTIEKAYDERADVHYRIESQRKKKNSAGAEILRTTPIQELRTSTEVAMAHCINIFAAINGELSGEALTDPNEDPAPGGRLRAVDMNKAQAPQEAPEVSSQRLGTPSGNVVEEKPWIAYNSNGYPNLGSYAFGASLGIDNFVLKILAEAGLDVVSEDNDELIIKISKAILDVTNYVQVQAYKGTLNNADTILGSHAKSRGVVFSTIEDHISLEDVFDGTEIDDEALSQWQRQVSTFAGRRMARSIRLGFPEFFAPGSEIYIAGETDEDAVTATAETINDLKTLVTDSKVENVNSISALLFKTFGTAKASEVSNAFLEEFIKFYGEHGIENFVAVAERAYTDVQSN